MTQASPLHILLTRKITEAQEARLRALVPRARILRESDIAADPGCAEEAFEVFPGNLGRWLRGEPLQNVVDRSRGY